MNFPSCHKLKTTSLNKTVLFSASASLHQQKAAFQKHLYDLTDIYNYSK